MKAKIFLLVIAFLIVACSQKTSTEKDKALVDSLIKTASDAWSSGDIEKAMSIYADDALLISGQIKMGGKDSISIGWKNIIPYAKNFKIYQCVSSVSEEMVFIESLFTFDWNQGSYSALAKGVTIMVWKRQADNTWKITYQEENHGDLKK